MDYRLFKTHCLLLLAAYLFSSCSPYRQINKSARQDVLAVEAFATAHTGISIYEPATGKYWYNYQGINISCRQVIQNFLPVMQL